MTRCVCTLVGIVACVFVTPSAAPADDVLRPIERADSVFAVFTVREAGIRPIAAPSRNLIFSAWADGHVVWSEDGVNGGPPYRSAEIKPDRVARLFARLKNDGVLDDQALSRVYIGPDAPYTSILIQSQKQHFLMQSWHELFEANGKTVGTQRGITGLESQRRYDVLKGEPADYLYYRLVWSDLRLAACALKPSESVPVTGELQMGAPGMSWRETKTKPKR